MNQQPELSVVTGQYLSDFFKILNTMIQGMTTAPLTDSVSHNFIVQMIPHHEAAIAMSKNLLQYTTLIPLQNIAQNIITSQTKSIADMQAAFNACSALQNTKQELELYQRQFDRITHTMFDHMLNACSDNNLNANFIREMIPHHKGAIAMSKNALRFPICPALKPILQAIIVSQTKGVQEMQRLQQCIVNG